MSSVTGPWKKCGSSAFMCLPQYNKCYDCTAILQFKMANMEEEKLKGVMSKYLSRCVVKKISLDGTLKKKKEF